MQIVVFEDAAVSQLEPITLGRAAYSIQCGSFCLADWLQDRDASLRGLVRPHLHDWQAAEYPRLSSHPTQGYRLLLNARLVPCRHNFLTLQTLLASGGSGVVMQGEMLAAALLPPGTPGPDSLHDPGAVGAFLRHPAVQALPVLEHPLKLLNYPHDLIRFHLESLEESLNMRIAQGRYREVRDGLFVSKNAELAEWVDIDTTQGPIVVEPGVCVRSFACLRGPLYLGAMSRVNEHAVIRPGVSVGPMSKVGGEIEASVIEAFTNKQHLGYLGHSYLGRWVNLGAGTSNSNLKNTYGTVRIDVQNRRVDTGMQFLGCIVGDYTKSAINTAIFTGKLIGACSMLYGHITTNVPSFTNYARSLGDVTELSPTIVAQTQKRVFLRRGIEQQRWHVALLHEMHRQVSAGRQLADRPVSL